MLKFPPIQLSDLSSNNDIYSSALPENNTQGYQAQQPSQSGQWRGIKRFSHNAALALQIPGEFLIFSSERSCCSSQFKSLLLKKYLNLIYPIIESF